MYYLFVGWLGLSALMGVLSLLAVLRTMRSVPKLADTEAPASYQWPSLSIVIPACNEEETLQSALQTVLAEDYPDVEIILINDRSTDQTGQVIDEMAAQDQRIRSIHIESLPEGWLGKVHALHQGVSVATGEWILITDADVHYQVGTIKKAVSYAQQHQRDFLTMFPRLVPGSPLLNIAYSTFLTAVILTIKAWEIPDPNTEAFTGIGHFMLLRQEAFAKTEGFAWLKMEVVDDGGLGLMMKRSGASCEFLNGAGQLSLRWYASFRDMARSLEKNMFAASSHYSYPMLLISTLLTAATLLVPTFALFATHSPVLQGLGVVFFVSITAAGALVSRWFQLRVIPGLFLWLGAWLLLGTHWRSALRCWQQQGIVWRGTHYPLDALRRGLRVHRKNS